jgi:hypothetical protein
MDPSARASLLARYREGPVEVRRAVAGIGEADLDARPEPDGWTVREIIHHLADSEMTSALRLRRLIAEDRPVIQGYDEAEFARRLRYSERPIEPSLLAVEAARATSADLAERLTEEEWNRSGTHTESGRYGTDTWLEIYAEHAHDHAAQIRRVRAAGAGSS